MKCYLVGGFVRDSLLGVETKDRDWVVVGASPQEMLDAGFQQVGKDFPVFLHPDSHEEYALARTEKKTGPGYKGFSVYAAADVSLEQDLRRRDLTINAMAMTEQGQIIDPFSGQKDLQARILRHVSPAFSEDPVRILRLARFAARLSPFKFVIAPETKRLMSDMVEAGEVDALVPERVWAEFHAALQTQRPSVFFQVLRSCGALAILFPEMQALFGVPQPVLHHPEIDVGIHTLMVLDVAAKLSQETMVRFAALTHDLGKGQTAPEMWPRHHGHEERSVELIKQFAKRYIIPKEYRDLALLVAKYHGTVHRSEEIKAKTILQILKALDVWRRPKRLARFLTACEADSRGRLGFEDRVYPSPQIFIEAYDACKKIDTQLLTAQGHSGKEFADRLHELRITEVKKVLKKSRQ